MFLEFHLEGENLDILNRLKQKKIEYLYHVSPPIYKNSRKSINIIIKKEQYNEFVNIFFPDNQTNRSEKKSDLKIWMKKNNHWDFPNQKEEEQDYFAEFHLESEALILFKDLQNEQISYIHEPTYSHLKEDFVATNIVILKKDTFALLNIIAKQNRKHQKEKPKRIIAYRKKENEWYPLNRQEKMSLLEEMKGKIDENLVLEEIENQSNENHYEYFFPYKENWRIYYNPVTDIVIAIERNSKPTPRIQFFKQNPTNDFESEIVTILESKIENTPEKKRSREA